MREDLNKAVSLTGHKSNMATTTTRSPRPAPSNTPDLLESSIDETHHLQREKQTYSKLDIILNIY